MKVENSPLIPFKPDSHKDEGVVYFRSNPSFFDNTRVYLVFPNKSRDLTFLINFAVEVSFFKEGEYQEKAWVWNGNRVSFSSFSSKILEEVKKIAKVFEVTLDPFERVDDLYDEYGELECQVYHSSFGNVLVAKGQREINPTEVLEYLYGL
jgi:hypothetical protein